MSRSCPAPVHRRRAALAAAVALVSVAAACGDGPVAPAPRGAPGAAVGAREPVPPPILGTSVIVRVVDASGAPLQVGVRFEHVGSGHTVGANDNIWNDGDPRVGYVKVFMPYTSGSFTATTLGSSEHSGASTTGPRTGSLTDLGTLVLQQKPMLTVNFQDASGALLAGGALEVVRMSDWVKLDSLGDNSTVDLDQTPGRIRIRVNTNEQVLVRQTRAPVSHQGAKNSPTTITMPWGGSGTVHWLHDPFVLK